MNATGIVHNKINNTNAITIETDLRSLTYGCANVSEIFSQ